MMRTIRKGLGLGVLAALAILAGCSSSATKIRPADLPDIKSSVEMKIVWSRSVGSAGKYTFSPAPVGDRIYAAGANGTVSKIALDNGSEEWRVNAGMDLTAGVGSDGKVVVVAGEKGTLLAFDALDGKLRWKVQASSEVLSSPVVGGGIVVVRSIDNRIAGYDAESGKRKWVLDRPAPTLTLRTSPGMEVVGPTVVVALPGGRLLSLNLSNGGPRWEVLVGEPRGTTELERIADIAGFPAVFGHSVCAAAYQGKVACVDVVNGTLRWSKMLATGAGAGMSLDERYVYAVDERGSVYAFSGESGQSVWRNDKLTYRGLSAPVALGRFIAVGDYQGYMHFLSREDGAFVSRVPTDGSPILTRPLLVGSMMIVQTRSGTLAALAPK